MLITNYNNMTSYLKQIVIIFMYGVVYLIDTVIFKFEWNINKRLNNTVFYDKNCQLWCVLCVLSNICGGIGIVIDNGIV